MDPTCSGIGRDPRALARISASSGLNVVMGGGFYLQASHPDRVAGMSASDIADEIVHEALDGVDGSFACASGSSARSASPATSPSRRSARLRGAAQAQVRTGLPLMIHLPGWYRHGHRVLDVVAGRGRRASAHTVLCHMNPSGHDVDYQTSLAARGAFLEFDMIGMDFWYADQQVQCPSDDDNARAITGLIGNGFLDRSAAVSGRVSQDDADPLRRLRLRLPPAPLPPPAANATASPRTPSSRLMVDNPRRVFSSESMETKPE